MTTEFANNLIRLRGDKDLTQQELGDAIGVSPSQISRYEAGQAKPRKTMLRKLADALEVSAEDLVGSVAEPDTVRIVLEEPDGQEMALNLSRATYDQMREASLASGKTVGEVISETISWGLRMMKESPEFAASLKSNAQGSRKGKDVE